MKLERVTLFEDRPDVYLDCFVNDPLPACARGAVIVIPGGAYAAVCADREGDPVAMAFIPYGYNTFVLHYTVGRRRRFPAQLTEAAAAVHYVRSHAEALGVDPHRVFVCGFSAGGHLAGSIGVLYDHPAVQALFPGENVRPDGMVLCYPDVSGLLPDSVRGGTFRNVLCSDCPTEDELREVSLELHVTDKSAPLFIVHTSTDKGSDVEHSLSLVHAYHAAGLPFELHVLPDAPHGWALGNRVTWNGDPRWDNPALADWVKLAAGWMEHIR